MHITDEMLHEAVAAMEPTFDSHKLIEHLMRRHPREYVRDLYSRIETVDPIQQGHAAIARRLVGVTSIEKNERPESPTVRGTSNDNQGWRKK